MLNLTLWFYAGLVIGIFGTIATVWGHGVEDPVVRIINTEVAGIGISLILLTYNYTLALLTLTATTLVCTLILLRVIIRLEEIGADV